MTTRIIDRIDARRDALGLLDADLNRAADLPKGLLTQARKGSTGNVNTATLQRLAPVLQTTVAELLGEATPAAVAVDPTIQRIGLIQLTRSHLNPRRTFDDDAIRDLAESIAVQGLLQNLVARKDDEQPIYWIVAGERRFRALELLQREGRLPIEIAEHGVPCRIIEANDAEHLALALLENLQRVDVNPMEEAAAFAQLQALDPEKWTTEEIAKAIGKIRATGDGEPDRKEIRSGMRFVQQRLALVEKLAPEAQAALREGKLTFSQARALSMANPDTQRAIAANAASYPTEADIRRAITNTMFPMDRAFFPMEAWQGPISEDPETGQRFYPDKVQFLRLQQESCERMVEEMRGRWAWAEVRDHCYEANDPKADRTKAGCVITLDPYTGQVDVREGVLRAVGASAARRMTPEEIAAEAARKALIERKEAATKEWKAALAHRCATSQDVSLMVSLLLLDRLQAKQYGSDSVLGYAQAGLPAALFRSVGPLAALGPHSEKAIDGNKRIKDDALDGDQILIELLAMPATKLAEVLATWIASRLRIYWHEPPHPALIMLSNRWGITVPKVLLGEDDEAAAPQQVDIEDAIAATVASDSPSVACRVRSVLAKVGGFDASSPILDAEYLAVECGVRGPAEAIELGDALAEEFGFERPPFVVDPTLAGGGLDEIGLATVGDLVAFLEKRLSTMSPAAE